MTEETEEPKYDLSAAGGGDVGIVDDHEILGPCPSCCSDLRICRALNPNTGRVARAIVHPVPFCTYYGKTDPATIERDVESARTRKRYTKL